MTAEEIRTRAKDFEWGNVHPSWLAEIAAQLAELNERLRRKQALEGVKDYDPDCHPLSQTFNIAGDAE